MKDGLKSTNGSINWKLGEWQKHDGVLTMCEAGFHASEKILQAFGYVKPGLIARVEVRGEHISKEGKQVWSEMRVVEAKEWTKADSVALAIFAARLVLPIWEKKHPKDQRVRNCIETVERYASGDKTVTREIILVAARNAADAADAALSAATYAASAASAASAATSAAYAAYAADAADAAVHADAAAYAASDAARVQVRAQCEQFILDRIASKPATQFPQAQHPHR